MVPGRAREAGAGGVGCRQPKTPHVGGDPDPGPVVGDSVAGGRHSSWALASDVRVQCLCLSLSSQHQTPFPLVRPCSPVPVLSVPHWSPSKAAGAPSGGGGTASRGSQGLNETSSFMESIDWRPDAECSENPCDQNNNTCALDVGHSLPSGGRWRGEEVEKAAGERGKEAPPVTCPSEMPFSVCFLVYPPPSDHCPIPRDARSGSWREGR